ncbi:MAG: hypothetical protein RIR00_230 [Pseudomonadota bacterium]|jgi:hypothetical protein
MKHLLIISLLTLSGLSLAQEDEMTIRRSTLPSGLQITGQTEMRATSVNSTAVASGVDNAARNTAGAIKGNTQIQGNTTINATQRNSVAVSSGRGSSSVNETGAIGGQ